MHIRVLKRSWVGPTLGILALVVLYLLFAWLKLDANVVAAGASALAAIAALASATASGNTARDAVRALSYATKPVLSFQCFNPDEEGAMLLIVNESPHAVGRLRISWTNRDGSEGAREYGYMSGVERFGAPAVGRVQHLFTNTGRNNGTDIFTIDYWGTSGPVGWRIPMRWTHEYRSDGYSRTEDRGTETEISSQ